MNYQQFKDKLLASLQRDIPEPKTISLSTVAKNNGIYLDSVVIMEGNSNVAPSMYLDHYFHEYQEGESFQVVYENFLHTYQSFRIHNMVDIGFFTDYDKVCDKIVYKLINKEKNEVFLNDTPFVPFLDLAIVFYILVDCGEPFENASLIIRNSHMDFWDVTVEQLFDRAKTNTPKLLPESHVSMFTLMEGWAKDGLCENPFPDSDVPHEMMVISNERMLFGAAVILYEGVLKEIATQLQMEHCYLIPSSVHEILLVSADDDYRDAAWINSMICDINETQLQAANVLSDHVYCYSASTDRVTMESW